MPHAVRVSPVGNGSRARLALMVHQRDWHLDAEPVAGAPVADMPPIEEAHESGQIGTTVQHACRQKDPLQNEGSAYERVCFRTRTSQNG
jgi:hypothetical protein